MMKARGYAEWEKGTPITDDLYAVGLVSRESFIRLICQERPSLGACWARCCQRWEEDQDAVDPKTLDDQGTYRHVAVECRAAST